MGFAPPTQWAEAAGPSVWACDLAEEIADEIMKQADENLDGRLDEEECARLLGPRGTPP